MFRTQINNKGNTTRQNPDRAPATPAARVARNSLWQSLALRRRAIQPKLAISHPGDAYEQEADRIADNVMRMTVGNEPRFSTGNSSNLQRKCGPCEEEDKKLQRKEHGANAESSEAALPLVHEALSSPGQPLDPHTRSFMEERFVHDFSHVRVHNDGRAADAARAVNALAYTVDQHVVFGHGQFRPTTESGRKLLAHELAHTIQQGSGANRQIQRAAECKADQPVDPDTLGQPLFVRAKSDIEKLGLRKHTVKPRVEGLPYVLFSPHCEAGKVPLKSLVEGGEAYLISSGKIYKQVWAQQKDKPADKAYWGWVNPRLIEPVASPSSPPPAPAAAPPKTEPPQTCPGAGEQATCETPELTAKPDVQCPESLDDEAALRCFAESVREEVRHRAEGDIYQLRLKQAIELMQRAGFGRLEGTWKQFEPGGPLEWEGETFNKNYWKVEDHPKYLRKLVLKPDMHPAAAIDDMFATLGSWKVDCGQFVQVAHLYALRHALGTKGFNKMNKKDVGFVLQPQASTAVRRVKFYERFSPTAQMLRYPEKELETKSTDDLLKEAPIGSRILWRNLQGSGTAYYNENTLKLADDQFAAHGFMKELKKNVFTRKELELALARITNPAADEEYIRTNVFIQEIEHYQMPQNPKR